MPILTEQHQDAGDFFEQRRVYRAEALKSLREREGIPAPELVEGRWQYRDSEGKLHPWAQGRRKQKPKEEMDQFWGAGVPSFEVMEVSEDGKPLKQELRDLARDAELVAQTQGVSHGDHGEPVADFVLESLDDKNVDEALQDRIGKHERD